MLQCNRSRIWGTKRHQNVYARTLSYNCGFIQQYDALGVPTTDTILWRLGNHASVGFIAQGLGYLLGGRRLGRCFGVDLGPWGLCCAKSAREGLVRGVNGKDMQSETVLWLLEREGGVG